MAICAVNNGKIGWRKEKETGWLEKRRIEARFNEEIISKLEKYTKTKAIREK